MDNMFWVWVLAICDNLHITLMLGGVIVAAASCIVWGVARDTATAATEELVRKVVKITLPLAACAVLISTLIPDTKSLLRAYMMVEGSKVLNSDNAETVSKEILKRVDSVIGHIKDDSE